MTVAYLRSHSYENDGRLTRYLKICKDENIDFMVFDWDRTGRSDIIVDCDWRKPFNYKAKTGSGLKNLFSLSLFNFYLVWQLIKFRNKYHFIHAADLDTLIPALIASKLFNKHLIFDIYDKYSASREMPTLLAKFFDSLEAVGIKTAHNVIVPHDCRIQQLHIDKLSLKGNVKVFENIPLMTDTDLNTTKIVDEMVKSWFSFRKKFEICLTYVGILESKHRGLENLLKAVSMHSNVGLIIAGTGELSAFVQEYAIEYDNILYVGRVSPELAHYLLEAVDIHVGFYYTTIPNHIYASPNKYYEHLFYGKAMLTNNDVPPGQLVVEYDTGYVIEQRYDSIISFLNSVRLNDVEIKGGNARVLWEKKYSGYSKYMKCEYVKILKNV